jgi:hypothetical protein
MNTGSRVGVPKQEKEEVDNTKDHNQRKVLKMSLSFAMCLSAETPVAGGMWGTGYSVFTTAYYKIDLNYPPLEACTVFRFQRRIFYRN